jgi:beta-phosphoglucomutase
MPGCFRGAIFDLDGTIVDNKDYHKQAWIEVCRRHGSPFTDDTYFKRIHARTNETILRNLFGENLTASQQGIGLEKELAYRELYRQHVRAAPGLVEFLSELKVALVQCAVASNSPAGNVDLVLDSLKIRSQFEVIITADDVVRGKPDPEIFHTAAARLGVPLSACIIFEDSPAGFAAARNADCPFVAITHGACPDSRDNTEGAIAVCNDFTALSVRGIQSLL